jgi:hypothetical protein
MKKKYAWIISDDLFFVSNIASQLKESDWEFKSFSAEILTAEADAEFPQLAVVNLNSNKYDPVQVITTLKKSVYTKVLGFCGHGQTELFQKGQKAGCDWVVPNSVAARQLLKFLNANFAEI